MDKRVTELDSGLFLVEEVKPMKISPNPSKSQKLKCAYCETYSTQDYVFLFGFRTDDNWDIDHPTCGHGKYVTCPACKKLERYGCPICGRQEVYT